MDEFLIAACGVSPLRGRLKDSALKNPAALERLANFFLWVRVCGCCALEKQNAKYPLRGRLIISLNISKATACCAVTRNTGGGSPLRVCWCCSPEHKKQKENRKSSSPIKQNAIYHQSARFFRPSARKYHLRQRKLSQSAMLPILPLFCPCGISLP